MIVINQANVANPVFGRLKPDGSIATVRPSAGKLNCHPRMGLPRTIFILICVGLPHFAPPRLHGFRPRLRHPGFDRIKRQSE